MHRVANKWHVAVLHFKAVIHCHGKSSYWEQMTIRYKDVQCPRELTSGYIRPSVTQVNTEVTILKCEKPGMTGSVTNTVHTRSRAPLQYAHVTINVIFPATLQRRGLR